MIIFHRTTTYLKTKSRRDLEDQERNSEGNQSQDVHLLDNKVVTYQSPKKEKKLQQSSNQNNDTKIT